jgi:hypothetical protein
MNGDYPSRNFALMFERRFQDIEENAKHGNRIGFVSDVKYDKELKRWYVRFEDKTDGKDEDAFKSDWLPWRTMASGAINVSMPPTKGQSVEYRAPWGNPERATVEPYHNNPDNPSPSDKPGEYHMRVQKTDKDGKPIEDKNTTLDFHYSKDGATTSIGDTNQNVTKDTVQHKTKNTVVDTENDKTTAKNHQLQTENRSVQAKVTTIKSESYSLGGKVLINC